MKVHKLAAWVDVLQAWFDVLHLHTDLSDNAAAFQSRRTQGLRRRVRGGGLGMPSAKLMSSAADASVPSSSGALWADRRPKPTVKFGANQAINREA
jgi:hypothetical protein